MIPELDRPPITISPAWRLDEDCPARAWPVLDLAIAGAPMHVYALRVDLDCDEAQALWAPEGQEADADLGAELQGLQDSVNGGGPFELTTLPGLEGNWCVFAHPHGA